MTQNQSIKKLLQPKDYSKQRREIPQKKREYNSQSRKMKSFKRDSRINRIYERVCRKSQINISKQAIEKHKTDKEDQEYFNSRIKESQKQIQVLQNQNIKLKKQIEKKSSNQISFNNETRADEQIQSFIIFNELRRKYQVLQNEYDVKIQQFKNYQEQNLRRQSQLIILQPYLSITLGPAHTSKQRSIGFLIKFFILKTQMEHAYSQLSGDLSHTIKIAEPLEFQAKAIFGKDFSDLSRNELDSSKQITKELDSLINGNLQTPSIQEKLNQLERQALLQEREIMGFEKQLLEKSRIEIIDRNKYLQDNQKRYHSQADKILLSSEKLKKEVSKILQARQANREQKQGELQNIESRVDQMVKLSQASKNGFQIMGIVLDFTSSKLQKMLSQSDTQLNQNMIYIKELNQFLGSLTTDIHKQKMLEKNLRSLQDEFNKLLQKLMNQNAALQIQKSNSEQDDEFKEPQHPKGIFSYQSNSSAEPLKLQKLQSVEIKKTHSKTSSITDDQGLNLQNVNEVSFISQLSESDQDSFKNANQQPDSLAYAFPSNEESQEIEYATTNQQFPNIFKQISSPIEESYELMDALNHFINNLRTKLLTIQRDQQLLLHDTAFNDYEKKKEVASFKVELDKKLKLIDALIEERDALFEELNTLEMTKLSGHLEAQVKISPEIFEEVSRRIKQLRIKSEDQLHEEIHYCLQVNQKIVQKYEYKKSILGNALGNYESLDFEIKDCLNQSNELKAFLQLLETQCLSLTKSSNQSKVVNKEDHETILILQSFMEQNTSCKTRIEELQQDVEAIQQIIQSNNRDVVLHETKVVKTLKIEEFSKLLQNTQIKFSRIQEQYLSIEQLIRDLRLSQETFIVKTRGSRELDMSFKLCQLEDSISNDLEPMIVDLNSILNDFRSYLMSKSSLISSQDFSFLDMDEKLKQASQFEANKDSYISNLQLVNSKFNLLDHSNFTLEESRQILNEAGNIYDRVQKDIELIKAFIIKLKRMFKEYIENNDEEMRRNKLINDLKLITQDNQRLESVLYSKFAFFEEESRQFQTLLKAINSCQDFKAKKQYYEKQARRIQEFQLEVQNMREKQRLQKQSEQTLIAIEANLKELRASLTTAEDINYALQVIERDLDEILNSLSKKRIKIGDADLNRIQYARAQEIEKIREDMKIQDKNLCEFEIALQQRSFEKNQDKFSPEKQNALFKSLKDMKQEYDDTKESVDGVDLKLKQLRHTQLQYLKPIENLLSLKTNGRLDFIQIAQLISELDKLEHQLKQAKINFDKLTLDLSTKTNQISSLDVEKRLKRLQQQILTSLNDEERIRQRILNQMQVTQNYLQGGYTSSDPDEEFFQVVGQEIKELLSDYNLQTKQFELLMNDTISLNQSISNKRANSLTHALSENEMEYWNEAINKLELKTGRLKQQRKELEAQILASRERLAYHDVDLKLGRRKQEAEELERIIEDISEDVSSIKERLQSDLEECQLTGENRFVQYTDKLSKLIDQTDQVQGNASDINSRRLEIEQAIEFSILELSNGSFDVEQRIQGLDQNLNFKKEVQLILKQIQKLHAQVKQLFTSTNSALATKPSDQIFKPPPGADEVDKMLSEILNRLGFYVPIKKLGGGYYNFGTKKIFCKIINGKLVVRVGGGYMGIEEFIVQHGQLELERLNSQAVVEQRMKERDEQRQIKARVKTAAGKAMREKIAQKTEANDLIKRAGSARGVKEEWKGNLEEEKVRYLDVGSDDENDVNSSRAFGTHQPIQQSLSVKYSHQKPVAVRAKFSSKNRDELATANQSKNNISATPIRRLNSPSSTSKSDKDDIYSQGGASIGGESASNSSVAVRSAQALRTKISGNASTKYTAPDSSFLKKGISNLPGKQV